MEFVTDFADQAVVVPIALVIGVALLVQGWRRGAVAWAITIIATFAVMLLMKLLLIPCGAEEINTPSGHVASATVVAGALAAMLRRRRSVVLPVAMLAAIIIGASRLLLKVHTWPEVVVGALIGMLGAVLMERLAGTPPATISVRGLVLAALVVAAVFHCVHVPAEAQIRSTAWGLAHYLGVCPADQARL